MKHLSSTGIAVLFFLSACGSQAIGTSSLRVAVSPAAQPVSEAIADCAPINEKVTFSVEMQYPSVVSLNEFDLLIRLGDPIQDSGFAAQLAWEKIVLITNPDNDLEISRDVAASLYSSRVQNWSELGGDDAAVTLWAGPESDEARQAFEASVLLFGPISGGTRLATNPATGLEAVANDPGSLAILPTAWADDSVRQIDLGLQIPVIAITAEEPTGLVRDLLACLQSRAGQELLANHYTPFQP